MKKILFLINSLEGGGAEKVLSIITNNLVEKYNITIVTLYDEGIYKKALDERINYRAIIKKPTLNKKRIMYRVFKYIPASILHFMFIKGKYDIEIGFLEGICSKIISAANKHTRKIGWIHTDMESIPKKNWDFINSYYARKYYDSLDKVVCVSNDAKNAYYNKIQPQRKNGIVIYNPIDKIDILNKSNTRLERNIENKFIITAIGRLVTVKGFERLIDVVKKLLSDYPIELWIFGEGPLNDTLNDKIKFYEIEDSVVLFGFKDNIYPYLAASNLYVCTSLFEGYSLTVAEALVLGVPVVSTSCTGPNELLDYGNYGLIVENSMDGLYYGIKEVIDNKELLLNLKRKAIERGNKFSLDFTMKLVEELFDND